MLLRITDAGRAALADGANVGVAGVRITKVLVGSGQGPGGAGDDTRVALRNQRDSAVAGGSTMVPARVLVRGDVAATASYNITEVGLEARVGAAGAPFLFAYWSNAGEVFAAAVAGVVVLVVAAIDVVPETPAELSVDVSPTVQAEFSSTFAGLTDTPSGGLAAGAYYRVRNVGDALALVAATAAEVLADLFSGIASARYIRKTGGGFQALTRGEVAQDLLAGIGQSEYLRRTSSGTFEGLTRAEALSDLLSGLDDDDFVRVSVAGGQRRLVGLTVAEFAALFRRRGVVANFAVGARGYVTVATLMNVPAGWFVTGYARVAVSPAGWGMRLLGAGGQVLATASNPRGTADRTLQTIAPGGNVSLAVSGTNQNARVAEGFIEARAF